MREIVLDGSECAPLIFPTFGKVSLASGGRGHTLEDGGGNRLQLRFLRADHINGDPRRLGEFGDVFRWHYAGVIRAVGENDDNSSAGVLGSIFYGQQESVVKSS